MNRQTHCTEEELIAWQLGETPAAAVKAHLELCAHCAAEAEAIAETLRVFSAGPVPRVNLDHAWGRMRAHLPALAAGPRPLRGRLWAWAVPGLAACGLFGLLALHQIVPGHWTAPAHSASSKPDAATAAEVVLHGDGPLSAEPQDPATAEHLASAERLLTEVSHAEGRLSSTTRSQAHELLLTNAVYVQKAQGRGDAPEAAVLEKLGRTLTTLDHEAPDEGKGWHLRLEMNTDGLLLDLRILQQNDRQQNDRQQNDRQQNDHRDAAADQSQSAGKDLQ